MKLIKEIIEMLSSDPPNLNNALFKTKVLLHELGEKELFSWVDAELKGYSDIESIPEYRIIPMTAMGSISNLGYRYSSHPLPLSHLDIKIRKQFETSYLHQSIAVLESYAKDDSNLTVHFPPEIYPALSKGLGGGFEVERAWGKPSVGSMIQVINEVRSRLLDFVLQLSEKIPNEVDSDEIKKISKEVGTSDLFRNAVFGDNVTVIVGNSNIQNIRNTVVKNDFESLAEELQKHLVHKEDISSLKKAINADRDAPELKDKKFGPNVREWIICMFGKATEAVWNINVSVEGY